MTDDDPERTPLPDRTAEREKAEQMRTAQAKRAATELEADRAAVRDALESLLTGALQRGAITHAVASEANEAMHAAPEPVEERHRRYEAIVLDEMRVLIDAAGESEASKAATAARRSYGPERARLAGPLGRCNGASFAAYEPSRHPAAARALDAVLAFSRGRPPTAGVLLLGAIGLGKTHLLLASHFALLAGGVESVYLTTLELRVLFRRCNSYDTDDAREAEAVLATIRRARAVHLDDLGDVDSDDRKRGEFAEGAKALRDTSIGAWCVASNCGDTEARAHPDIGPKLLDRLYDGATVVPMRGPSQRRAANVSR